MRWTTSSEARTSACLEGSRLPPKENNGRVWGRRGCGGWGEVPNQYYRAEYRLLRRQSIDLRTLIATSRIEDDAVSHLWKRQAVRLERFGELVEAALLYDQEVELVLIEAVKNGNDLPQPSYDVVCFPGPASVSASGSIGAMDVSMRATPNYSAHFSARVGMRCARKMACNHDSAIHRIVFKVTRSAKHKFWGVFSPPSFFTNHVSVTRFHSIGM